MLRTYTFSNYTACTHVWCLPCLRQGISIKYEITSEDREDDVVAKVLQVVTENEDGAEPNLHIQDVGFFWYLMHDPESFRRRVLSAVRNGLSYHAAFSCPATWVERVRDEHGKERNRVAECSWSNLEIIDVDDDDQPLSKGDNGQRRGAQSDDDQPLSKDDSGQLRGGSAGEEQGADEIDRVGDGNRPSDREGDGNNQSDGDDGDDDGNNQMCIICKQEPYYRSDCHNWCNAHMEEHLIRHYEFEHPTDDSGDWNQAFAEHFVAEHHAEQGDVTWSAEDIVQAISRLGLDPVTPFVCPFPTCLKSMTFIKSLQEDGTAQAVSFLLSPRALDLKLELVVDHKSIQPLSQGALTALQAAYNAKYFYDSSGSIVEEEEALDNAPVTWEVEKKDFYQKAAWTITLFNCFFLQANMSNAGVRDLKLTTEGVMNWDCFKRILQAMHEVTENPETKAVRRYKTAGEMLLALREWVLKKSTKVAESDESSSANAAHGRRKTREQTEDYDQSDFVIPFNAEDAKHAAVTLLVDGDAADMSSQLRQVYRTARTRKIGALAVDFLQRVASVWPAENRSVLLL
ncbi:hypothetical protein HDU96_002687, partial [Phlyctochytrium bullatum]